MHKIPCTEAETYKRKFAEQNVHPSHLVSLMQQQKFKEAMDTIRQALSHGGSFAKEEHVLVISLALHVSASTMQHGRANQR